MPTMSAFHQIRIFLIVIVLLSLAVFYPSLGGDFLFDDFPAIVNNPDLSAGRTDPWNIFAHDFWGDNITSRASHKSYRPITTLTFWLQKNFKPALSTEPLYFHVINVLLHCANCCLAFAICLQITSRPIAMLASLIFSLHPIHAEAVCAAVGRADLLCTLFLLMALRLNLGQIHGALKLLSVVGLSTLSVLSKEQGIMSMPIIIAWDLTSAKLTSKSGVRRVALKTALLVVCTAGSVLGRLWICGFTAPTFQLGDNPFAKVESTPLWLVNLGYLHAIHMWLLLNPDWLCFDWAMGCVPVLAQVWQWRSLSVLLHLLVWTVLVCSVALKRHRGYLSFFYIMLVWLPFIPASGLLINVGFVVAERNLYLSVLGYALLVATGYYRAQSTFARWRPALRLCCLLMMAAFLTKSLMRSFDWRNEYDLYRSGLKVCPQNAKIYYNLAKVLTNRGGSTELAEGLYRKAIHWWPEYEHALNNLGNLLRHKGQKHEAKALFLRALAIRPQFPACWMNLGVVQASLNEFGDAERSYLTALQQRKAYPDCHYNLATLYLKMRRYSDAERHLRRAIELHRHHLAAWTNLIIMQDNMDLHEECVEIALQACSLFPHQPDFRFHLANCFGKLGRLADAEIQYLEAISMRPPQEVKPIYLVNLGVLYHRWNRIPEAMSCYRKALSIDPDNLSAKSNLMTLTRKNP